MILTTLTACSSEYAYDLDKTQLTVEQADLVAKTKMTVYTYILKDLYSISTEADYNAFIEKHGDKFTEDCLELIFDGFTFVDSSIDIKISLDYSYYDLFNKEKEKYYYVLKIQYGTLFTKARVFLEVRDNKITFLKGWWDLIGYTETRWVY